MAEARARAGNHPRSPSVAPVIRYAGRTHVADILALWAAADAVPTITDTADSLGILIEHDPKAMIVAELEGRVVGAVIASWDGWRGSVYRLAVAPAYRRKGWGQRLSTRPRRDSPRWVQGDGRPSSLRPIPRPWASGGQSGWEEQTQRVRFVTE
jgi:hypothetical protein